MKKLAVVWYTLLFYPVIIILQSLNVGSDISPAVFPLTAAVSLACSFAGYFIRFLFYRAEKFHSKAVFFTEMLPWIAAAAVMSCLHTDMSILLNWYMVIIIYIGAKIYDMELRNIVSPAYVIVSSVLYLAASLSMKISGVRLFYFLLLPYFLLIFIWLFLSNSRNIKIMMSSRNYDEKFLPSKIMVFNRKLTAVVCVTAGAVLLLYRIMVKFVSGVIYLLGKFLIFILSKDKDGGEGDLIAEIPEKPPEIINETTGKFPSRILQYILIAIAAAVGIFLFIYAVRKGLFSKMFRALVNSIGLLFNRGDSVETTEGYTDTYEDISDEENQGEVSARKKYRRWNEQYKKYLSMNEGIEKFRFGYQLVAMWIRITDPAASLSETPYQLAERINEKSVDKITEEYYPVRYGDRKCDINNIYTADDALRNLKNEIRRNRKTKK